MGNSQLLSKDIFCLEKINNDEQSMKINDQVQKYFVALLLYLIEGLKIEIEFLGKYY